MELTYSCLSTSTIYTTMHSFTIALISTLSLGVHAASIGDSVSQLVSREQHNRLFHNPDFTSTNLPAAESFEPAGKISPRQNALGGFLGGMVTSGPESFQIDSTQAAAGAQSNTFSPVNLVSGVLSRPSNVNTLPLVQAVGTQANAQAATNSAQTVNAQANAQATTNNAQAVNAQENAQANAQANNAQAVAQAMFNAQIAEVVENARVAINAVVSDTQTIVKAMATTNNAQIVTAQATTDTALAAINNLAIHTETVAEALTRISTMVATYSAQVNTQGAQNFAGSVVARSDSQQDAVKRQTGLLYVPALPITLPITQPANNTASRREDNTKLLDDQVEDMDFSAHDPEADEMEEGF